MAWQDIIRQAVADSRRRARPVDAAVEDAALIADTTSVRPEDQRAAQADYEAIKNRQMNQERIKAGFEPDILRRAPEAGAPKDRPAIPDAPSSGQQAAQDLVRLEDEYARAIKVLEAQAAQGGDTSAAFDRVAHLNSFRVVPDAPPVTDRAPTGRMMESGPGILQIPEFNDSNLSPDRYGFEPSMPLSESWDRYGNRLVDPDAPMPVSFRPDSIGFGSPRELTEEIAPKKKKSERGNVNLRAQPEVRNPNGSVSTVDSKSFEIDGREVLLPSITPDGRRLTDDEMVREYQKTGRHLGKFGSPQEATKYAKTLHDDYAAGKHDFDPDKFVGEAKAAMDSPGPSEHDLRQDMPSDRRIDPSKVSGLSAVATPPVPEPSWRSGRFFTRPRAGASTDGLKDPFAEPRQPGEPIDPFAGPQMAAPGESWSHEDALMAEAEDAGIRPRSTTGIAATATPPTAAPAPRPRPTGWDAYKDRMGRTEGLPDYRYRVRGVL